MFSVTLAELAGKLEGRYILLESQSSGILPCQVLQRPSRGGVNEITSTAERENAPYRKPALEEATCPDCSRHRLSNLVLVFSIAFINNLVPFPVSQGQILSESDYTNMSSVCFLFPGFSSISDSLCW